ncbi:hypothetical protein EVAR_11032_1 [Eumeta japonica]|uniref:RNase H type-1 domain-containing protein n=1 Tax=Eumeta variegata TaxID=151549 RepID=A0A4C1U3X5_EUMVA|nr:hypothetical protein EVAR_11032_1 [Eumeta japonica]
MYALYRAVAMVKASREKVVNILSDSRSSLELLSNPRAGHPLAHAIGKVQETLTLKEKKYEIEANTGPDTNIHRTHGNSGVRKQIQAEKERERLRKQIQAEKETKNREAKELAREQRSETAKARFDNRGQGKASTSKKITNDSPKSSPKPTKADLGEVKLPSLCLSRTERPHEERLPSSLH